MTASETVPVDAALHLAVSQFLFREARLLDERRYEEWLDLLTEDMTYEMPLTLTREGAESARVHDYEMTYFSENIHSLRMRVDRLRTDYAWAEDPPTRTRHLLSNLEVYATDEPGVLTTHAAFVVYANRGSLPDWDQYVGTRQDTVVRHGDSWKVRRRLLLLDQALLGTNSISVFL
jgi:3-phenylpropionate/cinnamic acid dioxygenase small subunit